MTSKSPAPKATPVRAATDKPDQRLVGKALDQSQLKQVGGGNSQTPVRGW